MTTILAIETSTEFASAAIISVRGRFIRELSGVETHSKGIIPALQSLLAEAGVQLSECDALAFGCGPGAFTGIRTACGIIQGMAYAADLPVLPVVSLRAMAQAAASSAPDSELVCLLDARMGEHYWAQYRNVNGVLSETAQPELLRLEEGELLRRCASLGAVTVVTGNGVSVPDDFPCPVLSVMPHAREVAELALQDFMQGLAQPASQAQPLYLRNKIALTTAERALKGHV